MPTWPAEIVPELLMPPKKLVTPLNTSPVSFAEILPELKMPPPALAAPNWVTSVTLMPMSLVATIVPELLMPPEKVGR